MDKLPVCYGQGIAPYCPRCGSGEYLNNEDGNENNFCGQCGCPLDWSQMHNEDTEQVESWGMELWGWCDCGKAIEGRWVGLANFCPWCGRVIEWERDE